MNPDREELVANYGEMGETELMDLARSYDTLTDPAQTTLRAEFARRGLEPPLVDEPDGPPEQRHLVTIRQYRDLSEAIVARSLLESAGIPVYLRDENLVRLDWQVSNFIGGIRLQVDTANERSSVELLDQPVPATIELSEGEEFTQPHCPACGSTEITFNGASRGAALPSLIFLAVPLPTGRQTWSCAACGAKWEDTES